MITREQVEATETFKKAEPFKKTLLVKKQNIAHLSEVYFWAQREGLEYVKQNPNYCETDIKIIKELLL